MTKVKITVIVNDQAVFQSDEVQHQLQEEHGLSLAIEGLEKKILFDTGGNKTLLSNAKTLGVRLNEIDYLILSHGHYDHTGGLISFLQNNSQAVICHGSNIEKQRFSCSNSAPVREISMPEYCRNTFVSLPKERKKKTDSFQLLLNDLYLSGPIPRESLEDTGGPFFLDPERKCPDLISEEQSLIIKSNHENLLITGCCHSGIINTLNYCRQNGHPIQNVLGGLHLLRASEERLKMTLDYLNQAEIKNLYLLHCTGENAIEFFKQYFKGNTIELRAGSIVDIN